MKDETYEQPHALKSVPNETVATNAPPMISSATDELATLKAENEHLKDIVRKCNRDWYRLKDFIIGCNGPGEMIRFQEAAQKNNNKGVEMFLSYLDSLWRELDKKTSTKPPPQK